MVTTMMVWSESFAARISQNCNFYASYPNFLSTEKNTMSRTFKHNMKPRLSPLSYLMFEQ
jgi:hypothetical protein